MTVDPFFLSRGTVVPSGRNRTRGSHTLLAALAMLAWAAPAHAATGPRCTVRAGEGQTVIEAIILNDTPDPQPGRVIIDTHGVIQCAGATCQPAVPHPTVISCPQDSLSPGFINPHDHIDYTGDAPQPDTGERFEHRNEWRKGLDGHTELKDATADTSPELIAWGELRFLISGITSMVGDDMAPGLVRNLDFAKGLEGLPQRPVTYKIFPLDDVSGIMRTHDCDYGHHPSTPADVAATPAFLAHVAEGTNGAAHNEFRCLSSNTYDRTPQEGGGGISQDMMQPGMTILHGVGLGANDFDLLHNRGISLVWSPRSNLSLYGRTVDIPAALAHGVTIALGTDWLPSGSMNMSRELACAVRYDHDHLASALSSRDLWRMATRGGADAVHGGSIMGTIAPGHVADLVLFRPQGQTPYDAAAQSTPGTVDLVMRGGHVLYGDRRVVRHLHQPGCENAVIDGQAKAFCIKTDQRFSFATLKRDMARRHIYPLVTTGTPPNEPPCETLEETRARLPNARLTGPG